MAIAGKNANVFITATVATTAAAEAFSAVAGSSVAWKVAASSKRHWDLTPGTTTRPVMYTDATTAGTPAYTVNYVQGQVVFASTIGSTVAVTGDIEWFQASEVVEGRAWTLNITQDLFETPVFGSSGWRVYSPNVAGATINISKYWGGSASTDEGDPGHPAHFFDLINLDTPLLIEMIPDESAGDKYEAYGYITQDSITAVVDGVVEEGIDINVHGAVYYSTSI